MIALFVGKVILLGQEIALWRGNSLEHCEILASLEKHGLLLLGWDIQRPLGVGGVERDVPGVCVCERERERGCG